MAKKYVTVGNVTVSQKDKSRYIKVNLNPADGKEIVLRSGDYINMRSFEEELSRLEGLVADSRMKPETLEKIRERFEKDKTFGAFALAVVSQEE